MGCEVHGRVSVVSGGVCVVVWQGEEGRRGEAVSGVEVCDVVRGCVVGRVVVGNFVERECMRVVMMVVVGFFFASGRRHTRFTSDWSSDVCSSDLIGSPVIVLKIPAGTPALSASSQRADAENGVSGAGLMTIGHPAAKAGAAFRVIIAAGKFHGAMATVTPTARSEECRVGKACRFRRSPDQYDKNPCNLG